MNIKYKDKNYEFESSVNGKEILKRIGGRLNKEALAIKVDGVLKDLSNIIDKDADVDFVTFNDPEGKNLYWHSSAHLMAYAVKCLWPDVKIAIGPSIENGFYYDFDKKEPFSPSDLEKIEKKMKELTKDKDSDSKFYRTEITKEQALKMFGDEGEIYKVELIEELPQDSIITSYRVGNFVDLCRGPHLYDLSAIKSFKLLNIAGAYWRGSEKNKMLQRIYAVSFPKEKLLKEHLELLEEAKKRDHRKLGKELGLFHLDDTVGGGLVLWHPKGARLKENIERFWKKKHFKGGYDLVASPHIGKANLWETSGHLGFYSENMYSPMDIDGENYFIKPMNCPFHIQIYKSDRRSYRELPCRYAEMGTVYRYERSGVLHGLLRVRGFTQDDAHIICTKEQMESEILRVLKFSLDMLESFGFNDYHIYVATRPDEKCVGEPEKWEAAQKALEKAVTALELKYDLDNGGGAFYGPKIDIKIKDALGREWQCSTIQFDFNLPDRFDMTYIDSEGNQARPFMIHRALLGSLERFIGVLIEHYGGAFPLWLAPVQAKIITIAERHTQYAEKIKAILTEKEVRVITDFRNEKIGYKIRQAQTEKTPLMIIIGDEEVENNKITVRERSGHNTKDLDILDFFEKYNAELDK